jgi:hypothetical protein
MGLSLIAEVVILECPNIIAYLETYQFGLDTAPAGDT